MATLQVIYLNSVAHYKLIGSWGWVWVCFLIVSDPDLAPTDKMWQGMRWHGGERWHLRSIGSTWGSSDESVWEMVPSVHPFTHASSQSKFLGPYHPNLKLYVLSWHRGRDLSFLKNQVHSSRVKKQHWFLSGYTKSGGITIADSWKARYQQPWMMGWTGMNPAQSILGKLFSAAAL